MATALEFYKALKTSTQNSTTATYADYLSLTIDRSGGGFTTKNFFVIAHFNLATSDTANRLKVRCRHDTTDLMEIEGPLRLTKTSDLSGMHFHCVKRVSLTAASHTVTLEFARFSGSGNAIGVNGSIVVIEESAGALYEERTTESCNTNDVFQDAVTITFTPSVEDDYLFIWALEVQPLDDDDTGTHVQFINTTDSVIYSISRRQETNAQNDGEWRTAGGSSFDTVQTSEHSFKIQFKGKSANDRLCVRKGAIVAIPFADFENTYTDCNGPGACGTNAKTFHDRDDGWTDGNVGIASQAVNTADHLVIAGLEFSNEAIESGAFRLVSAGTNIESRNWSDRDEDDEEYYQSFHVHGVALTSGNETFKVQGNSSSANNAREGVLNQVYMFIGEIPAGGGGVENFEDVFGALTFVGAVSTLTTFRRAVAGVLTFIGTATRASGLFFRTVTGALTSSGLVIKKTFKTAAGALSFAGVVSAAVTFRRSLPGALTFIGTVTKKTFKATAGALTFSGVVSAVTTFHRTVTGAITFSGNAAKKLFQAVAGTLSFSGIATRVVTFARTVTGAITFAGAVSTLATFRRAVVGTLTFIGTATRASGLFFRTVTGNLSFVGTVAKKMFEAVSGALTFIGTATRVVVFSRVVTGTLTFIGTVTPLKTFFRTVTGTLTFAGDVTKRILKGVIGVLTFIGDGVPVRGGVTPQPVGGTLSFIGTAVKKTEKPVAGALTFAGAVTRIFQRLRALAGTLTFVGLVTPSTTFRRTVAGALSFVGLTTKKALKGVTGVLTFSGVTTRASGVFHRTVTGSLTFIGGVGIKLLEAVAGVLSFVGGVLTSHIRGGIPDLTAPITPNTGWVLSPTTLVTWRDRDAACPSDKYIELRVEENKTDGTPEGAARVDTSNNIKMDIVPGQQLEFRARVRWAKGTGDTGGPASDLCINLGNGVVANTVVATGDTLTNTSGWNLIMVTVTAIAAATEFPFTILIKSNSITSNPYLEAWGVDDVELYRKPC